MIELLFRAKRMVGGNLWLKDCRGYVEDDEGFWLYHTKKGSYECERIKRETLGLYVGRVDIHGARIYEGDYLMVVLPNDDGEDEPSETYEIGYVAYDGERGEFCIKYDGSSMSDELFTQKFIQEYKVEMVGNVFDGYKLKEGLVRIQDSPFDTYYMKKEVAEDAIRGK